MERRSFPCSFRFCKHSFNRVPASATVESVERTAPVLRGVDERHDAQTIQGCRQGDKRALARVLESESRYLERVLFRILGDVPDVEDVLQTTFVAAIHGFPNYRGEASVRTWMTRIAVRTALAHLERPERTKRAPLVVMSSPTSSEGVSEELDERIDDRARIARLQHHLRNIGPKKRTAFLLHVCDGRSIAEIATLMGATKTATKSRIFWARRELMRAARRDPILRELLDEDDR
jgi:RNA polymerase sigma-70 factor, ECF subfamily